MMKTMILSKTLVLILPVLISVAFITLTERKILSLTGTRIGPNKVSMQGILQPMADAVKLSNKSTNQLSNFSMILYYISAIFMLTLSLMLWSTAMINSSSLNWKLSFLIMMLILGISAMKSIMAGWSTFSKYSLIGSMRTVSQMISYESVIYLCIMNMIWISKNFNMNEMVNQKYLMNCVILPATLYFWLPSMLAELNRTPYDFSEGESELVSGFNTEFGAKSFTLIFLSEYSNIMFFMTLTVFLFFFSNNLINMIAIILMMLFWVIWIRSTLPRMRFDKFMEKAWKFYIPFMTLVVCLTAVNI